MSAVLVTGASGLVGKALVAALAGAQRPVIALTRRTRADWPAGVTQRLTPGLETLDAQGWSKALAGAETIIHAAGIAHTGAGVAPGQHEAVNHLATAALAAAARRAGVRRLVFLSSIRAIAGPSHQSVLTEATLPAPTDPYGASKLAAERAIAASGIEHVILRPVVIVAPDAPGNIATLRRIARLPLPLPLGGLDARRSLVAIEDVVAIALRALDDPAMAGRIFILADPEAFTTAEMVGLIRAGMGRTPGIVTLPQPLLALAATITGQRQLLQRMAGPLVADPAGLTALGITFEHGARRALRDLARDPG